MTVLRGIDVGALEHGISLQPPGSSADRPTPREWAQVLAEIPLFQTVAKRQLRRIAELAEFVEFGPDELVIQAGTPGDGFYLILGGSARVVGQPRARRLKTGDFFGEMALLDGGPRGATITADGELQVMRLPRRPFMKLLERDPRIAIALLAEVAARLRRSQQSGR